MRVREMMYTILAKHTRQDEQKLLTDTDRDFFMSAEEAKAYGVIDEVMVYRS
jgi:ATP-dependent Clp protease protease subunit